MGEQLSIAWCDVCQRQLTSAESRARGRGPKCHSKLHGRRRRPPRRRDPYGGRDLFDELEEGDR